MADEDLYYSRHPVRWEREAPQSERYKQGKGSLLTRASRDGGPIAVAKEAARDASSRVQQDRRNALFTQWTKRARQDRRSGPITVASAPGMAGKTRRARKQNWRGLGSLKGTDLTEALKSHQQIQPYAPDTGDRSLQQSQARQRQVERRPTAAALHAFMKRLPAGTVELVAKHALSGRSPSRANEAARNLVANTLLPNPQPVQAPSSSSGRSWAYTNSFEDARSNTIPSTKASANSGTASAPPASSVGSPWSRWSGDGGTRRKHPRTRRRKQKKQRKSRKRARR